MVKSGSKRRSHRGYQNRHRARRRVTGTSSSDDDLGLLFDLYLKRAQVEDEERVEDWNEVAQRTLFVSTLISAVVATFLVASAQDEPTFYLKNINQLLADPNRTDVSTPPTQSNPPTFSPSRSAVWVNSLWSLDLAITLSCALLAILLQQWARRYTRVTLPRPATSPDKRARTRAFFTKGVEKLHLQLTVDALLILLHTSLVLFLAGFVIFSFGSGRTVFTVVLSWVGLCIIIYACFTLLPIFRHDSPYHTPLSRLLRFLYTGAPYVAIRILRWFMAFYCCGEKTWIRVGHLQDHYRRQFSHCIEEVAEESAQKPSSEIDSHILLSALRSLDEDHELEWFLASIPGFRNSRVLNDPLATFKTSNGEKMADTLIGLMDRTLSSNVILQSTKQRRLMVCNRVMAEAALPINRQTLGRVLYGDRSGLLDSVEFGLLLRNSSYSDPFAEYYSQCVVSVIISKAKRDDRWFELATSHLAISKSTLDNYLAHGDSILLANCISICRRTMDAYSEDLDVYSRSKTLELVSRFDIQDTLPELQHEFCAIWNVLVRKSWDRRSRNLSIYVLKHIRKVYFGLHRDTAAVPTTFTNETSDDDIILLFPSSYRPCEIERHRSKSGVKRSGGPSPIAAPPVPQNVTPAPAPAGIQAIPSNGGNQYPPLPGFHSP